MTYHFKLVVLLTDISEDVDEAIYGQCNDSTISHRDGVMSITFDRQDSSLETAIASAIADVTSVAGLIIDHIEIPGTPDEWKKVG